MALPSLPSLGRWGVLLATVGTLYAPTLGYLFYDWWHNADYSHGFFIPPIAAFFLWRKREVLRSLAVRPVFAGIRHTTPSRFREMEISKCLMIYSSDF